MSSRPDLRDFVLLLLLAFIWGSSFTLIKVVVPYLPPWSLTLWRVTLAAITLLPVAWWLGARLHFSPAAWGWIVLAGLTGNVLPFTLISWGEEHIDSGLAAIIISMTPFMVLLLAHVFTGDERITPRRFLGMLLGFAGILVLIGPHSLRALGEDALRQLAIVGAAACYAVNTLIIRHLQLWHLYRNSPQQHCENATPGTADAWHAGAHPKPAAAARSLTAGGSVMLATAIMLASAAVMLPWVLWLEGVVLPPPSIIPWALMLGLMHTGLATLMMFAIVRRAGATFFATINFLIPVIGYLLGVFLLGEEFSWRAILALAFILAGILVVSGSLAPSGKTGLSGNSDSSVSSHRRRHDAASNNG